MKEGAEEARTNSNILGEELERWVLAALCQGKVSEDAKRMLAGYSWREPLHQAIFAALAGIPASDPDAIRRELPVRLTRRGFPDVDLAPFFGEVDLSSGEVEQLVRDSSDLR